MTEKEKRILRKQAKDLFAKADDDQTIVLCEDGIETTIDYPMCYVYERDCKSPMEWVNGIILHQDLKGKKSKLSFKIK